MVETNFNEIVHADRGKLLARMPKGAKTLCSAGCAGRWYFDWVEECYGPVDVHIGVELYSPRPDDLPANVRWIQNSVADMRDVRSGSVDLLFSGQNIEHLFYDDLVGFLREANRVVRDGGHICLDSPNRSITQELGYLQPQHVLELTVQDAIDLTEAAGFDIKSVDGIWDCAIGLKRYPVADAVTGDIEERRRTALEHPLSSFIWWIVARKARRVSPDLETVVQRIVSRSFRPFVAARFRNAVGTIESFEGTETILRLSESDFGHALFGPYIPLRAGEFVAEFDVRKLGDGGSLHFDVAARGGTQILATHTLGSGRTDWMKISLPFALAEFTEGVETRVLSQGAEALLRFGTLILRIDQLS